jgi:hypothetical protein
VLELDARGIFNPVAQLGLVHSNTPEHCVFLLCFGGLNQMVHFAFLWNLLWSLRLGSNSLSLTIQHLGWA